MSTSNTVLQRSMGARAAAYVLLAYAFSWALWLTAFRVGGPFQELVGIGVYGPALAGMVLSYSARRDGRARLWPRMVCFSVFWLIAAAVLYGRQWISNAPHLPPVLVCLIPGLIPAWILSAALSRNEGIRHYLRTLIRPNSWRWQAVAVLSFAAFLVGPASVARLFGGAVNPPNLAGRGHSLVLTGVILFAGTFFYGGGVSEEPGWRGYLLRQLQTRFCPLIATLIVWVAWALWHLPLDLHSPLGASLATYLGNRLMLLLPLTIIATWLYNRSGQSILTTALFHCAFNTLPDVLPSAPGMTWLLWTWAATVVMTDRMWRSTHGGEIAASV